MVVFAQEPGQEETGEAKGAAALTEDELMHLAETFAAFSEEERALAFKEVEELLADDPDALIEWELVKEQIGSIEVQPEPAVEVISLTADELSEATGVALESVSSSNWNQILDRKNAILDSLISKKKISAEDAALYTADPDAWETELKTIWDLLRFQAEQQQKTKDEL